ncbi:thermonuclease [Neisseriaceae bacterium PsAf]|nr:thermonuclease [Neisseriaceae bacterium PsAf]
MRKFLTFFVLGFLLLVVQAQNQNQNPYPIKYLANVVYIVDGDTLHAKDENGLKHKIRIANIDAPEMNQRDGKGSRENLLFLVDENVEVTTLYKDRYKREVSNIYYKNQDIALQQVRDGYAWIFPTYAKKYLTEDRLKIYYQAQEEAKMKKRGLWQNYEVIPPWVFRKNLKTI